MNKIWKEYNEKGVAETFKFWSENSLKINILLMLSNIIGHS